MTEPPIPPNVPAQAIAAWADWYVRVGVLDCVEDLGFDRRAATPEPQRPTLPQPAARPPDPPPPGRTATAEPEGVASARALAGRCRTLDELEAALRTFGGCPLAETATRLCFADGNPKAPVMLVGEAPGAEEDRQGKPFVGPSGRLLDRMLAAIGLGRQHVYITNLVYWRPPGNRPPTPGELATCQPFLERQIELLRPRILVSVGGVAAKALLDLKEGVTKLRGRRFTYQPADGGPPIPTFVVLHPAYLLRQPLQKRLAWRDMLQLKAEMLALGLRPGAEGGGTG